MAAELETATSRPVILLAPTSRDGSATRRLLASTGIECVLCRTLNDVCAHAADNSSAIILPEEVVLSSESDMLADQLRRQPVWSDLPVIVLTRAGAESPAVEKAMATFGNVSLIERPMRISTLLSVVRAALRARERQYQVRDYIEQARSVAEERTTLLESERAARAEAERAGRMKDEFLATLSHELRTPLNAILGWSQILSSNKVKDEKSIADGIRTIERNARAQTKIIEDLLDMSRIISGKVRLEVQRIDLVPVLQASVETVRPAADAKGVGLRTVLDSSAGPISGDPNRLQQVFWNLLYNAIKFTPKGGNVQVLLERVNSHLEISVIDTGEGILPEFLPHVFDRFRQADATTTRRHGGLGLGLAIVKQLVELHGGSVRVKSAGEGKGSTFVVTFPLTVIHPETKQEEKRRYAHVSEQGPPDLDKCGEIKGVRVMVVDDEPDSRDLVQRLLEDCNAVVYAASNAADALATIQRETPDVLISDIGLPGEDGYSLIRRVRALPAKSGGTIPAIALTAYARSEDRTRSVLAGFQMHLAKPVEPSELIAIVASLAGRTE